MPENDGPVFPRSPKDVEPESLEDARRRLAADERKFDPDFPELRKNTEPPTMLVYGPPSYFDRNASPPVPMYGPPPNWRSGDGTKNRTRIPVTVIAIVVLVLAALAGIAVVYLFFPSR